MDNVVKDTIVSAEEEIEQSIENWGMSRCASSTMGTYYVISFALQNNTNLRDLTASTSGIVMRME
jgi:hypothetical protein